MISKSDRVDAAAEESPPAISPQFQQLAIVLVAVLAGIVIAYLIAGGRSVLVVGALALVPTVVILKRYPLAVMAIWLLAAPFVVDTSADSTRRLYWLIHRAIPVAMLGMVLLVALLRRTKLPRLGWPELMMIGYLIAALLSVVYTSDDVTATTYHLYDRVFVPMCLYLLVRVLRPNERDLKRLLPVVIFILLSQAAIGILSWTSPQTLPATWLDREGSRTIGSLDHTNVYGTTLLFCGLIIVHALTNLPLRRVWRWVLTGLFVLALIMVFMTMGRANWLAGLVVMAGLLFVYPKFTRRFVAAAALLVVLALASGVISNQVELAQQRFYSESSEESALSRLPVVVASFRMFGEKPLTGWGYGNFDRFDRQYQTQVGNLVYPEKDHASHNLYLTILAEQGLVGILLYLGPAAYWLSRTRSVWGKVPATGMISRKLLAVLWLVLLSHLVVNNFANMRVVFGLGLWWITLGLIGSVVSQYSPHPSSSPKVGHTDHKGRPPRSSAASTGLRGPAK